MRLLPIAVFALPACMQARETDPHVPGDSLGTFQVAATLDSSSCGPGALGSTESWDFEVQLSRRDDNLYWLNGQEAIPGRIAADGVTFAFDTRASIELEPAGKGRIGCSVVRSDQASGTLSSPTLDVASVAGRLVFGYAPTPTSDCSALYGMEGGFSALPCQMAYDFEALRTSVPSKKTAR